MTYWIIVKISVRRNNNFVFFSVVVSIYFIWRERNNQRFSNIWRSPKDLNDVITHVICAKVKRWKSFEALKDRFSEILG